MAGDGAMKTAVRLAEVVPTPGTFQAWLSDRYAAKFTGPVTVHFLHGTVKAVEPRGERLLVLETVLHSRPNRAT